MSNQLTDIIRHLSPEKLRGDSSALEQELLSLKLAAGQQLLLSQQGQPSNRPAYADLFQNNQDIPEIGRKDLTVQTLAAGLLHHGALLIRGLYNQQQLERLNELAVAEEEANRAKNGVLGCNPHTLFELLAVYRESGLLSAVTGYLDDKPLMFAERTKLRHHRAGRDKYAAIPWHQDANFFGVTSRAVNCWAAITPCGRDNPGLEIIPWSPQERLFWNEAEGLAPLEYGRQIPEQDLAVITSRHPPVKLELEPGDAVLFDEMTLHRTAMRRWERKEQIVTISWFFRASGFPDWGTPLAV